MKVIVPQNKLKEGLSLVERSIGKSLSLPILTNILFEAKKNFLSVEATDLEIGVKAWSLAKVEKEGAIAVPASLVSNFIRLLPEGPIKIEADQALLFIETKKQKVEIKGGSSEDFPIIPQTRNDHFISLPSGLFCEALSQVVDIPATSSTRPEISGILFSFQKDSLQFVATDSFRLAEKTVSTPKIKVEKEVSFILPQKAAKEIINIFGPNEEKKIGNQEFKIYFTPSQVLIESLMAETPHPQVILVSKLIEGEYPNYQEIIPKKFETQMVLDKNEFLHQVKIAAIFAGKTNEIKFKIQPNKGNLIIFSQNPNSGQHESFITGEIKGKERDISFNYKFLIDGLSKIKNPKVIFELSEKNGEAGPGVLRPLDEQGYLYVLMPIQTN